MADYDVGVLGLSTPAALAPLAVCRPAVSVRNEGIHDAVASGYLRIYSAGLLIFESELYSNTLTPGQSGPAQAVDYWTPPAEGTYIIQGYLSCPLDQVQHNNNLHPVSVEISGAEPPPPTPVEPHAAQHEEDGGDELSLDGLAGRARDAQTALAHAASHMLTGPDQLNLAGLSGELVTPQPPKSHSNAAHSPLMATAEQLDLHNAQAAVHTAATNLANRETSGDDEGLVKDTQLVKGTQLPESDYNALRSDRYLGPAKHATLGDNGMVLTSLTPDASFQPIHSITIPALWLSDDDMILQIKVWAQLSLSPASLLELRLMSGAASWGTLSIPGHNDLTRHCVITAYIISAPDDKYTGNLEYRDDSLVLNNHVHRLLVKVLAENRPATEKLFTVTARITGIGGDLLTMSGSCARSLSAIP